MTKKKEINDTLETILKNCGEKPTDNVKNGTFSLIVKLIYNVRQDLAELREIITETLDNIRNEVEDEKERYENRMKEKKRELKKHDYYS